MNNLLVLRERFKQIYVSHSLLVRKGAQFLLALLVFNLINSNIGFMKMASSVLCTVGLAVVCTFLPLAVMTAAATVLIVAHLYTLSMPIAGVAVILFLLMYIFYFRFTPEKSWLILLTVVAFGMKIPLVIHIFSLNFKEFSFINIVQTSHACHFTIVMFNMKYCIPIIRISIYNMTHIPCNCFHTFSSLFLYLFLIYMQKKGVFLLYTPLVIESSSLRT